MVGEIAILTDYGEPYNPVGRIYTGVVRAAAGSVIRGLNNGESIVQSTERLAQEFGISTVAEYDPAFLRLVEQEEGRLPSFIFFSDHEYTVEPFAYMLGFPKTLKDRIVTSDQRNPDVQSCLCAIGSDMVPLAIPELSRYIFPVVLRDSDIQFLTCNERYVIRRRENRLATNEAALDSVAVFLIEPGSNLIIAPSGFVHAKRWKRGIARIMGLIQTHGDGVSENTFAVPISCNNLDAGDYKRLFFRAALAKFGLVHLVPGREFDVTFGPPVSVGEIMYDMPSPDASVEEQKEYMLQKTQKLQQQYYEWVETLQMGEI